MSVPLTEKVANKLIDFIIEKDLKAGQKLPNEMELSKLAGAGRSTVREAVKLLVSRNVLEVRQGAGTFVVGDRIGVGEDPLGFTFIKDKKKLVTDLLEIRVIIEPKIAGMAANYATEEDIAELDRLCVEIENRIFAEKDHVDLDILFHAQIAKCSQNLVAPTLMPIIQSSIPIFIDLTHKMLQRETVETHRAIMEAIRNRDAVSAQDSMLLHLVYIRAYLKKSNMENSMGL